MEYSGTSEGDNRPASQEIPSLLSKSKVHHRVHKGPQWHPILNHLNPIPYPFTLV